MNSMIMYMALCTCAYGGDHPDHAHYQDDEYYEEYTDDEQEHPLDLSRTSGSSWDSIDEHMDELCLDEQGYEQDVFSPQACDLRTDEVRRRDVDVSVEGGRAAGMYETGMVPYGGRMSGQGVSMVPGYGHDRTKQQGYGEEWIAGTEQSYGHYGREEIRAYDTHAPSYGCYGRETSTPTYIPESVPRHTSGIEYEIESTPGYEIESTPRYVLADMQASTSGYVPADTPASMSTDTSTDTPKSMSADSPESMAGYVPADIQAGTAASTSGYVPTYVPASTSKYEQASTSKYKQADIQASTSKYKPVNIQASTSGYVPAGTSGYVPSDIQASTSKYKQADIQASTSGHSSHHQQTSKRRPTSRSAHPTKRQQHFKAVIKDSDIRSTDNHRCNELSKLRGYKKFYCSVLHSLWHVFYGHYSTDTPEKTRIYVQHDDQMAIYEIFAMRDRQTLVCKVYSSITKVVTGYMGRGVSRLSTSLPCGKLGASRSSYIPSDTITHTITHRPSDTSECMLSLDSKLSACKDKHALPHTSTRTTSALPASDESVAFIINELTNAKNEPPMACTGLSDQMHYYAECADMLFRMMSIHVAKFKTLRHVNIHHGHVNIHHAYQQQVTTFFTNNIDIKLLLFPEIASLYQYRDEFIAMHFSDDVVYRPFIGYYVMCKFETLTDYLERHLLRHGLYSSNVLVHRLYVSEFFLCYVYATCFDMDVSWLMHCISMHRIHFLCTYRHADEPVCHASTYRHADEPASTYRHASKSVSKSASHANAHLINFLLYNITTAEGICPFIQLQDTVLAQHTEPDIDRLVSGIRRCMLGSADRRRHVLDSFMAALSSMQAVGISTGALIRHVGEDVSRTGNWAGSDSVISEWMRMLNDALAQTR